MGLSAQVFLRLDRVKIPQPYLSYVERVDPETGELDFKPGYENRHYQSLLAADERLGNISAIADLRRRISDLCGSGAPLLLDHVLGNSLGNSPPVLPRALDEIEKELTILEARAPREDSPVAEFLATMRRLTRAAREQGNAIILL